MRIILIVPEMLIGVRTPVEDRQTVVPCTYPQITLVILHGPKDIVATDAMRIPGNMFIMRKPAGVAVEQIQTAAIRTDPYIVMMILIYAKNMIVTQTMW